MANFPMVSALLDTELDTVSGGTFPIYNIRQNARGGRSIAVDSIAVGGNGDDATAGALGAATGGAGGNAASAASAAGGNRGTNTITF